jgi:DNA-binding NarL/FixJ family response regulator
VINEEKLKAHLWRQERINKRQEHIIKRQQGINKEIERRLKRLRERDKQLLALIKRVLEISKGTIEAIPTPKEVGARRAARKKLTKTEQTVYNLMFTLSYKEIASRLRKAPNTVKEQIASIRRKLGVPHGGKIDAYLS